MTADPIDRMIELLDGFEVPYDDLGIGLRHTACGINVGSTFGLYNYVGHAETQLDDDSLGSLVRAAITHAADCPGPPPPVEEATRKPCGSMHTGPCEVLDRQPGDGGEWVTYRHADGEGTVFNGAFA